MAGCGEFTSQEVHMNAVLLQVFQSVLKYET